MTYNNPHIIVVIPSYNEPEMMQTLHSLYRCERGNFAVEIILIINSYQISPDAIKHYNKEAYQEALRFAEQNNTENLYLTPLLIENLPGHQTGAGLPRKIGMDEALTHFRGEEKKRGIIVSLDADTTVEANYLTEIYKQFRKEKLKSATLQFHHPVEHLDPADPLRLATRLYEKYLRYYRHALAYTGYPYAYYTIGSAFAVTAETYVQAGGMGKQQAGEDFYFLQKVFPLGRTRFIDTTTVYPRARTSDRVPFGTGPAVAKMMQAGEIEKQTYRVEAFRELKSLFSLVDSFYNASPQEVAALLQTLPAHTQSFLEEDQFFAKIAEIKHHTGTVPAFRKRFFAHFSAFKILKYLNYTHPSVYPLANVEDEYTLLLSEDPQPAIN